MNDFLIIGGGLAGIVTAYNLLLRDNSLTIKIVDNSFDSAAWRVAAGIINPVSGKRIVKTVNAEEILASIVHLNNTLHKQTGETFFHPKPILRVFRDISEQNAWNKKLNNTVEYEDWIEEYDTAFLHAPYGCGIIKKGGYLDIRGLLKTIMHIIADKVTFHTSVFDANLYNKSNYTKEANKIIMCYGWEMMYNPLWSFLPFAPFKGEVLTVKMPVQLSDNFILNNGTYFLPLHNGTARIGATIEHNQLDYMPTEKAKNKLLQDFFSITGIIPEVIEHKAGIRPGIEDRYPVIGKHPHHNNTFILNGLGGRGAFYAPYCSVLLADFLLSEKEIPAQYSVHRYYHLYR